LEKAALRQPFSNGGSLFFPGTGPDVVAGADADYAWQYKVLDNTDYTSAK
jgi:hypothetical protein